jgi:hypothetical protein
MILMMIGAVATVSLKVANLPPLVYTIVIIAITYIFQALGLIPNCFTIVLTLTIIAFASYQVTRMFTSKSGGSE